MINNIQINRDARNYEAKPFFGFSGRNLFGLGLGGGSAILIFILLKNVFPKDILGFMAIIIALPFLIYGFNPKIKNVKICDLIKIKFISLNSINIRYYKIENLFSDIIKEQIEEKNIDELNDFYNNTKDDIKKTNKKEFFIC